MDCVEGDLEHVTQFQGSQRLLKAIKTCFDDFCKIGLVSIPHARFQAYTSMPRVHEHITASNGGIAYDGAPFAQTCGR